MSDIILINDVECELDKHGAIAGGSDSIMTSLGAKQSVQIAEFVSKKCPTIDYILASDSSRLTKFLHQIRLMSRVKRPKITYSHDLRERNFGVLTGTKFIGTTSSDLFRHSRICAEGGESVSQCSDRAMKFLKNNCSGDAKVILCVSHPFLCQIICNFVSNKPRTVLTRFWFQKGAMMVIGHEDHYVSKNFYDCINNKSYTVSEIYSELI